MNDEKLNQLYQSRKQALTKIRPTLPNNKGNSMLKGLNKAWPKLQFALGCCGLLSLSWFAFKPSHFSELREPTAIITHYEIHGLEPLLEGANATLGLGQLIAKKQHALEQVQHIHQLRGKLINTESGWLLTDCMQSSTIEIKPPVVASIEANHPELSLGMGDWLLLNLDQQGQLISLNQTAAPYCES